MAKLNFLAVFLLTLITNSIAFPTDELVHTLDKRSNKCPCAFAVADFDPKNSNGPVKGIITFAQDESGATTVAGIFSKGFEDTNATYEYQIKDDCGNVLHDLTKELNVQLSGDGGTESFRHKFDSINLNCDNKGILNVQTLGKVPLSKRNCKSLSKRDDKGNVVVSKNGEGYSNAKPT
ncbi:6783_t:CDS:1 [Funneliformis geosporum]|uniref:6783_t:CDS:1 n=1 Tax=Funneliformis geosporum TaxID=1117311 RepID=A0A9W4WTX6_9GLOM|nr:6783_t:CDS:1 [Funneliformis geosporum]